MPHTLETRATDGTVLWREEFPGDDVAASLSFALVNRHWARGPAKISGGYYLNPQLFVDGQPIADVLAALRMARAA